MNQVKHKTNISKPSSVHSDQTACQHGRVEKRQYELFPISPQELWFHKTWPSMTHVMRVIRHREVKGSQAGETVEISYYAVLWHDSLKARREEKSCQLFRKAIEHVSSLEEGLSAHELSILREAESLQDESEAKLIKLKKQAEPSAKMLSVPIRRHWHIENKLHYVKDKAMQEDICVRRKNPSIYSSLIDCSINIMRVNGVSNIKKQIYKLSLSIEKYIEDIVKNFF